MKTISIRSGNYGDSTFSKTMENHQMKMNIFTKKEAAGSVGRSPSLKFLSLYVVDAVLAEYLFLLATLEQPFEIA
ncbi:hypothetical protein AX15_001703 [Amanita polypyramis BW_CC]|nr:hypothetical protein AX15_001703 [Amanita polypyramis BW_CC]